jgi:U3 small nucleolar RNA-associated protein 22
MAPLPCHSPTIPPLQVNTVQALSATLRHTAPFFPQPHPLAGGPIAAGGLPSLPRCLAPLDLMVQLEGSGKWPDDPAAYSKMKAALGCQVALALEAGAGARWGTGPCCVCGCCNAAVLQWWTF